LGETGDTISAGQCNAEHGIATSWLQPLTTPSPDPGVCILHKPAEQASGRSFNHVVWQGQHQLVVPDIVCATPEGADDQKFRTISGKFCTTPSCQCSLPKLYVYLPDRGFPGRVADGEDDQALVEAEPEAEGQQQLDPHAVDARKAALHSLSCSPCDCTICGAAKQRRNRAEAGSHPDGNERFRHEPGLHSYSDSPTYYDTIDYGKEVAFTGNCRYDFFGINLQQAVGFACTLPIRRKIQFRML